VLAARAAAQKKGFEVVAQRRDADGEMIDRALEIVRKFICERDVVLFGGLAIDYALRLKGASIYPDDQRPDFDFLSTRSVEDAFDLADILANEGFPGVAAVRAIHVQTMKVRVDAVWVADVGYVPPDVYAAIPTFEYRGMRVVHPDFQRLDIHLAFCFPFNGPPREDVFHRWKKDAHRLNLLQELYPVTVAAAAAAAGGLSKIRGTLALPVVGPSAGELRVALHGFAAYSALRSALDELAGAEADVGAPRLELTFPDEKTVEVESPVGDECGVVFASPYPEEAVRGLPDVTWYDPYMEVCPELARAGGAVVLSTQDRLLAANVVAVAPGVRARTVTPHYLLEWLLLGSHRAPDETQKQVYRAYYAHTLEILNAVEVIYAGLIAGGANEAETMELYSKSPFSPSVRTLGEVNNSEAYIINMASAAAKLKDTPPAVLHLPPDLDARFAGLPPRRYVPGKTRPPAFDYNACVLFRRSGLARPK